MEPGQQPAARVCQKHGLVLDPQGQCVLCRRETEGEGEVEGVRGVPLIALLLLFVGLSGVMVYQAAKAAKPSPIVVNTAPPPPRPTAAEAIEELAEAKAEAQARDRERELDEQREALARRMREVEVKVFLTKSCELCRTATAYVTERGYKLIEVDAEASPENLAALTQANPKLSVPTIVIGEETIVGFGPSTVQAAVYRAALGPKR